MLHNLKDHTSNTATQPVTGYFAYGTLRLLDSSPTLWSFCLLDTSPTGHFAYETFRLLPGQFAYKYYNLILFYSGSHHSYSLSESLIIHGPILSPAT